MSMGPGPSRLIKDKDQSARLSFLGNSKRRVGDVSNKTTRGRRVPEGHSVALLLKAASLARY